MSLLTRFAAMMRTLLSPTVRRRVREVQRLKRLVRMVDATSETEIACEEAYRLLDVYCEMLVRGEDAGAVLPQVRRHLEMCMDCREELDALLAAVGASPEQP